MKLIFNDASQLDVQQVQSLNGQLIIKIINCSREQILETFSDELKTARIVVVDHRESIKYMGYTNIKYLTEYPGQIYEICIYQKGKSNYERINNIDQVLKILLGDSVEKEQVAMQTSRFIQMSIQAATLTDDMAMGFADLYETWREKTKYAANIILKYGVDAEGKTQLYRVVKDHVSQAHYPPDVDITHYKKIGFDEGGTPIWSQPLGQHDAYNTGDVVTHNGKTWISTVDNNVWEPGVYGWEVKE